MITNEWQLPKNFLKLYRCYNPLAAFLKTSQIGNPLKTNQTFTTAINNLPKTTENVLKAYNQQNCKCNKCYNTPLRLCCSITCTCINNTYLNLLFVAEFKCSLCCPYRLTKLLALLAALVRIYTQCHLCTLNCFKKHTLFPSYIKTYCGERAVAVKAGWIGHLCTSLCTHSMEMTADSALQQH